MKTPYDAAIRVRQRELDAVSSAIRSEAGALGAVADEHERLTATARREAHLAADDLLLSSPGWQRRVQDQRHSLSARQTELQARLDALRDAAIDGYGVMRGIEAAAQDYRTEAARGLAVAEQAASDDISAAAYLRTLRRQRSAR